MASIDRPSLARDPRLGLYERDLELGTFDTLFARVRARRGGRLLVLGPAGIGKSSLLEVATAQARAEGFLCLTAAAHEVGAQVAFAVAAEVLAGHWTPGKSADRAADEPEVTIPVLQAMAQLVLDLAESQPTLIFVDDIQWADPASLRWLVLLARRFAGTRVGLVLGVRTDGAAPSGELATLVDDRRAIVVRPAPLSLQAAGELVAEVLGAPLRDDLALACHRQTAGNPYLLTVLAGSLKQSGVALAAIEESLLTEIGARAISGGVSRQLAALDPATRALAEAVAAVGDIGGTARLARVARIDPVVAVDAAAMLTTAGLLRGAHSCLEFVHPLVGQAIRSGLPAARLVALVRTTTELLVEEDRLEEAAARLVELLPQADPAIAQILFSAADRALARGAPDVASVLLERALAEPPGDELLPEVWAALGQAQLTSDDPRAATSLERALGLAQSAESIASLALASALALALGGRLADAVSALDGARARLDVLDPDLAEEIEASTIHFCGFHVVQRADRVARLASWRAGRVARTELAHRLILGELAQESLLACGPARETATLAERALAGGTLLSRASPQHIKTALNLAYAGQTALARVHFQDAATQARRRGDLVGMAMALVLRGETRRLEGDMIATEVDTRTGAELLPHGERGVRFMLRGLIQSLAAQGRTDEAAELMREQALTGELPPVMPTPGMLHARALVRRQEGALAIALEDLLRAGEIAEQVGLTDPYAVPWRLAAAEILCELGESSEARALAEAHLELAMKTGLDESIGGALRVLGLIDGGADGHARLAEAIVRLERSAARLELAHALVDSGTLGLEVASPGARDELERGTRLAAELGATVLADHGVQALRAAGSRPRRIARRGAQALTAAEQRAARLAAEGLTNREIAQTLVLSEKTIESHLASTFRKLGIRSRLQLPDLLQIEGQGQGFSG